MHTTGYRQSISCVQLNKIKSEKNLISKKVNKYQGFRWNKEGENVLRLNSDHETKNFSIFLKAENLFNRYYMTEPGFPLKARTVAVGLKFNAGQIMDK